MRKIITIVFFVAVGLLLREHFQQENARDAAEAVQSARQRYAADPRNQLPERDDAASSRFTQTANYRCDGRKRCSQMRSCEEATWFIEHCPGMEMDGDRDGVPCEDQHCRY